jgi:hypothetical protein
MWARSFLWTIERFAYLHKPAEQEICRHLDATRLTDDSLQILGSADAQKARIQL